ncbi:MAG: hypothetical protein M0Z96_01545 [Actinomycetota bacterium]|nr:hypothetical protein [Actinomycetota bacterium]
MQADLRHNNGRLDLTPSLLEVAPSAPFNGISRFPEVSGLNIEDVIVAPNSTHVRSHNV